MCPQNFRPYPRLSHKVRLPFRYRTTVLIGVRLLFIIRTTGTGVRLPFASLFNRVKLGMFQCACDNPDTFRYTILDRIRIVTCHA